MQKLLISLITLASLSISACSIDQLRVYKIDVQQGNALEQQDVERIRTGMTKRQVEFLLGSPMLIDPFREDRWDYVFYFKPGYGKPHKAKLTLWFEGDQVSRIDQNGTFELPDQAARGKR
jgi:outer membrane protein assembly factor BamE